jgi:hypothetical protein
MDKNGFDALAANGWSKKYWYAVINRDKNRVFTDIFESENETDDE